MPTSSRRARKLDGSRQVGFTIIELIVTITIFAIMAGIAMPLMGNMVADQRVKTATNDLYASVIFARSEAIKRNKLVAVCAKNADGTACLNSTNWALGWIVFVDDANAGTPAAAADILKRQDAIPNVVVTGSSGHISYQRDGRLRVSDGVPFVASAPTGYTVKTRCLTLELSGRPSFKLDNDNNPSNGC